MEKYYTDIADAVFSKSGRTDLSDTFLVIYIHILSNNTSFIEALCSVGFKKENIFVVGKYYSTIPYAEERLKELGFYAETVGKPLAWGGLDDAVQDGIRQVCAVLKQKIGGGKADIIAAESGAVLREEMAETFGHNPNVRLAGLELTTQGTYSPYRYPTVDIATCYVKKGIEPCCVSVNILDNFSERGLIRSDWTYGFLGCGAIGSKVIKLLQDRGCHILCFDKRRQVVPADIYADLKKLVSVSDCIVGTTGYSSLDMQSVPYMKDRVTLISTSSRDTEFRDFLSVYQMPFDAEKVFDDLVIKTAENKEVVLINGGFPINCNRATCADRYEMPVTYGLWLAGILKAVECLGSNVAGKPVKVELEAEKQLMVVEQWVKYYRDKLPYARQVFAENFLAEMKEGNFEAK